jgi:hypothetical protein
MSDTRIVYGFGCVWWDSIDKTARNASDLPCCPHCGSVLFEIDEKDWIENIARHARESGDARYPKLIEWMRGKCFRTLARARAQFNAESGEPLLAICSLASDPARRVIVGSVERPCDSCGAVVIVAPTTLALPNVTRIECIACAAPKLPKLEIRPPSEAQRAELRAAGFADVWPLEERHGKPPASA